jgi:glucose/arabinose dehydrogenase
MAPVAVAVDAFGAAGGSGGEEPRLALRGRAEPDPVGGRRFDTMMGPLRRLVSIATLLASISAGCVSGEGSPSPSAAPTPAPQPSTSGGPSPSSAPTPSPGPTDPPFDPNLVTVTLEPVATIDGSPLAITSPLDGSGRLFVAAKEGQVWSLRDGAVGESPMLDIGGLVSGGGEQGLLGIAVHPGFPDDPRVFLFYTDLAGNEVVAAYRLDPANAERLDPGSAEILLTVEDPFGNHNGGALAFGPDGYLYAAMGDGGGGGDPLESGERLDTLLGKILRLDVDSGDQGGEPYGIPEGNPFTNLDGARPEIWLTGLRNPWRIAFDRATGDLWIGDVGQGRREEVDVARAGTSGLDFGWDRMEGTSCYEPETGCPTEGLTLPVTEYGHDEGCTIIGGHVYRGTAQAALRGGYLFGDYCSGNLWAIAATSTGTVPPVRVGSAGSGLAGFGEDEAGELYAANLDGTVSLVVVTER